MARGTTIDITYADRRLEKSCSNEREGAKRWGENWRALKLRLASLLAAETLADMSNVPGRCHALTGDRAGQYAVSLSGPHRLVFEVADPASARDSEGNIDLNRVTAIRILEIVNYHGS